MRPPLKNPSPAPPTYHLSLGNKSLLTLFFSLAAVCGMFFAFGYTLGKHAIPATFSLGTTPAPAPRVSLTPNAPPAASGVEAPDPSDLSAAEVHQEPGLDAAKDTTAPTAVQAVPAPAAATIQPAAVSTPPVAAMPPGTAHGQWLEIYLNHVNLPDAQAMVDTLQANHFPATVVTVAPDDFRVRVGPYLIESDLKNARNSLQDKHYTVTLVP